MLHCEAVGFPTALSKSLSPYRQPILPYAPVGTGTLTIDTCHHKAGSDHHHHETKASTVVIQQDQPVHSTLQRQSTEASISRTTIPIHLHPCPLTFGDPGEDSSQQPQETSVSL